MGEKFLRCIRLFVMVGVADSSTPGHHTALIDLLSCQARELEFGGEGAASSTGFAACHS